VRLYPLNFHVRQWPTRLERNTYVPALVEHLMATTCARFGMRPKTLEPAALECLMAYDWRHNNVRELRNVIERMIIATDREVLSMEDVPQEIRDHAPGPQRTTYQAPRTLQELKAEAERQIIVAALERHDWHIT